MRNDWKHVSTDELRTKLTQVEAKVETFQKCGVLTGVPDVEVHEDWQGGEGCNSQPSQHEDISKHDELRKTERDMHVFIDNVQVFPNYTI